MQLSVCVLCYGDYGDLARRCLESIWAADGWPYIRDVRIGLNAVGLPTRTYVAGLRAPVPVLRYVPERNVGKYPLMRRMFYGDQPPAEYVMWFDDDSYLTTPTPAWWQTVLTQLRTADLLGSMRAPWMPPGRLYSVPLRPGQVDGIKLQPWYTGREPGQLQIGSRHGGHHRVYFCTGGWWVARTAFLRQWDYPFPCLHHNGGDSILGELWHQQGYRYQHFQQGVAINADVHGQESKAPRRGLTRTPWAWEGYQPGQTMDLSHQQFACDITAAPSDERSTQTPAPVPGHQQGNAPARAGAGVPH